MNISTPGLVTYAMLTFMVILLIHELYRSFSESMKMKRERKKLKELLGNQPKHVNLFVSRPAAQPSDTEVEGKRRSGKLDADLSARSGMRDEH